MFIGPIADEHAVIVERVQITEPAAATIKTLYVGLGGTIEEHPSSRLVRKILCIEGTRHHTMMDFTHKLPVGLGCASAAS